MKNPLLTQLFSLIRDRDMKSLSTAILFMVLTVNVSLAQSPVITEQCYCLNNSTTPTNGQYRDEITLNTGIPGQTWRLVAPITGFYNPASLPPPAPPILYLNNTLLQEISPGIYRIRGIRISGQTWSARISNSFTGQIFNVASTQNCSYPSFSISGDEDVCRNSILPETYSLPAGTYSSLNWYLTGVGNAFSSANGSSSINVDWGPTAGRYSIGVSGVHFSYTSTTPQSPNPQPRGCDFNVARPIDIEDFTSLTTIRGDAGNCIGASEVYTLDASLANLSGVIWTIATVSGPVMASPVLPAFGDNDRQRTIVWPNIPGEYDLTVTGDYVLLNGPGGADNNSCSFTHTLRINIVSQPTVPLACNNVVNLSMNPSCELYFTPDQFLEAQEYPDHSYDIIIKDLSTGLIIPTGTLGYDYIGKTLEIKVVHECSGNSCWGYAKIEDKSIPDLICPDDIEIRCGDLDNLLVTGFPEMPIGSIRTPVIGKPNTWKITGFDRCSDVTLSFTDVAQTDLCEDDYSSIITRTWLVTDNSGNTSSCTQIISVIRATIDEVEFPLNFDNTTGPNGSLEACGTWPKIPFILNGVPQTFIMNGMVVNDSVPSPDTTGWPIGILCLKSAVSFTDKKILLCNNNPKTYKLIRKWVVVDHCTGEIEDQNQLITVMDTEPPVITCPADISSQPNAGPIIPAAVIPVKPNSCVADWTVIAPILISDCSTTSWEVHFKLADHDGKPPLNGLYVKKSGATEVVTVGSTVRIINLPAGRTWVRYTVTDACGNFTYCFTEIDVIDNQPPTPVCDRNSIVAIGNEGTAYAGVLTFDDGSHDNCGLVCMKVRRMDDLVDWRSLPCNNEIRFTCDDIGPNKTIMVELGVWDKAGLFNSCMVLAKVQDNIFPVLNVPKDVTANCNEDFTSLTRFGLATATDNCYVRIDSSRLDELNECGVGTITRTFTARDTFGNVVIRTQVINVLNSNPVVFNDIQWPGTATITNKCITGEIKPEDLPTGQQRPSLKSSANNKCKNVVYSYEDLKFKFSDGVCMKILRKWTAIDWCQANPFFPGQGIFTNTQLIMINNTIAPTITFGCLPAHLKIDQEGQCSARVTVRAKATEIATGDCPSQEPLKWSYSIDINNDGIVEFKDIPGDSINTILVYGTHKISWSVKDGCNNERKCDNIFTISDTKKPTPYCISDLVTVIMPSSKEVTIWASEFDRGSQDNCSVGNQITASFSGTNRNDISRTIRCADLEGAPSKEFSYNVYAIDAAGNSDFCTVRLRVQDNGNSCSTPVTEGEGEKISIRGNIYNDSDDMVQNVFIELRSNQTEFPKSAITTADGKFSFGNLPMYKEYTVTADKNDDVLNGVSTLDLVMIQRHILGLNPLDSPHKLIAADVNNSQKITAADLLELRKLILGIQTQFSNNRSWRFVDIAHIFADPGHPFPFTDYVQMNNLDHSVAGLDFVAIKVGDVNGSALANAYSGVETSNRNIVSLTTENITAKAGDIVNVTLSAAELTHLLGMQFTLAFDNQMAELVEIKSDVLDLKDENLGFSHLSKGLIHLSWNNSTPLTVGNSLVSIRIKLLKDVNEKALVALDRSFMNPEIYFKEENGIAVSSIRLETENRINTSTDKFELYQNVPNPFNASTVIGFNLPKSDEVTLKIYDVTGKMVHVSKSRFNKGYNTFNIDAGTLNLNGVMYYQIDTETDSATRKMIIIK